MGKLILLFIPALLSAQMSMGVLGDTHHTSGSTSYTYSRSLTIDRTKMGASNLTNYPVLVSIITANDFKISGSGGHIINSTTSLSGPSVTMPADLIITSDSLCATKIPWEVEHWDSTAGTLKLWFLGATVNGSGAGSNSVFYVCYGASGITTAQNTGANVPANVWNSNYKAVWHLGNGTTLATVDSTSNANTETSHSATATTGQVDGAAAFNASQNIIYPNSSSLLVGSAFTVETWALKNNNSSAYAIMDKRAGGAGYLMAFNTSQGLECLISGASATADTYWGASTLSSSAQHNAVCTYDGANISAYADGAALPYASGSSPTVATGSTNDAAASYHIGETGSGAARLDGKVDEMRLSNIAVSAAYVASAYANMNAPGNIGANNFIIFSAEITN